LDAIPALRCEPTRGRRLSHRRTSERLLPRRPRARGASPRPPGGV